jgi:hypothetical protein
MAKFGKIYWHKASGRRVYASPQSFEAYESENGGMTVFGINKPGYEILPMEEDWPSHDWPTHEIRWIDKVVFDQAYSIDPPETMPTTNAEDNKVGAELSERDLKELGEKQKQYVKTESEVVWAKPMSHGLFERGRRGVSDAPETPGYEVSCGRSWSRTWMPKDLFDSICVPDGKLSFSQAVGVLKGGGKISRRGLFVNAGPGFFHAFFAKKCWISLSPQGDSFDLCNSDGVVLHEWRPSFEDVFANDWHLVVP